MSKNKVTNIRRIVLPQFYVKGGYSVVSNKQTGGDNRTGGAEFCHLLHEKQVRGGTKTSKYVVKRPCSLNKYYRVS